jgi:GNAT superfamily N-acetyltransferase
VTHPVGLVLAAAVRGEFPEPDGSVEIVPPWQGGVEGVVALTGRAYVATELPADHVLARDVDGFGSALAPAFIGWLAGPGGWLDCLDVLVGAMGTGAGGPPRRDDLLEHRRARHARQVRGEVVVHADERGVVTVGAGIGGLAEIGVEVAESHRNRGVGRSLVADALGLFLSAEPVLGAVTPGNAASLRAFLAAGFRPLGAVHLVRPSRG